MVLNPLLQPRYLSDQSHVLVTYPLAHALVVTQILAAEENENDLGLALPSGICGEG
jgi:hypothetical protein